MKKKLQHEKCTSLRVLKNLQRVSQKQMGFFGNSAVRFSPFSPLHLPRFKHPFSEDTFSAVTAHPLCDFLLIKKALDVSIRSSFS